MLNFLYIEDYNDSLGDASNDGQLLCNTKLYEAAHFYLLPELQKLAIKKFEITLFGYDWSMEGLREALQYISNSTDFPDTALQVILLHAATDNADEVANDTAFLNMLF